jgi:UDP-N-acetylmuramoyl-tripeptide--D-alanyl-D-alanine ligase
MPERTSSERTLAMAAAAMDGRVIEGDPAARWRGAAIDSRRVEGGELFFALPGEKADGHDYVADAGRRGAAAAVVHRDVEPPGGACGLVRVAATFAALHALTRAVRAAVPRQLVAVTGSTGKTTTKELLAAMLGRRFATARNPGNLNNLYGFPVALLGVPDYCAWMVAEMGMSVPGELGQVSRLGRPDAVVFTNVRAVHLENFADLAAIADAKAEIFAGLADGGLVVANADDPEVERIVRRHAAEHRVRLVRYAVRDRGAEVTATPPRPREDGRVGSRFELAAGGETVAVELPVHGLYNAENCLAAAACAHALGVPLAEIRAAAAAFTPAAGRGEVFRLAGGVTLVDDTYNSNPDAAEKALESARALAGERWVAVLGEMLELGGAAGGFHRRVGARAAALGFDPIVGVGELARELLAGAVRHGAAGRGVTASHFGDAAQAAVGLPSAVRPGDVVLVKGSRGVGLEAVVRALRVELAPEREDG